jgi:hypothetical protein
MKFLIYSRHGYLAGLAHKLKLENNDEIGRAHV